MTKTARVKQQQCETKCKNNVENYEKKLSNIATKFREHTAVFTWEGGGVTIPPSYEKIRGMVYKIIQKILTV